MNTPQNTISRSAFLCLIAVYVFCFAHSTVVQLADPLQLNWDPSMYLHFAQMLLNGGVPYVDFVDINPPLIIYLSVIPAFVAHLINVHIIVIFKFVIELFAIFSFCLILATVKRRFLDDEKWLYLACVLAVIACTGSVIGREFGQREHIFLLSYLPFFFVRWSRWEGQTPNRTIAIIAGLFAAIGLCLKPQFLTMPILCELYWLFRFRKWRTLFTPETITCLIALVSYPVHFLLVPHAMRDAFKQIIVEYPLFQNFYGCSWLLSLVLGGRYWPQIFVAFLGSVLTASFLRKKHPIIPPLIVFTIAGYLSVVIQRKWWDYYKIPMWLGILMLAGIVVAALIRGAGFKLKQSGTSEGFYEKLVMVTLAVAGLGFFGMDSAKILPAINAFSLEEPTAGRALSARLKEALDEKAKVSPMLATLMREVKPGDRELMISEILLPEYPAILQYGVQLGSRYPFPFLMGINKLAEFQAISSNNSTSAAKFHERVGEEIGKILDDASARQPRIIFLKQESKELDSCRAQSNFSQRLLSGFREVDSFSESPDVVPWKYRVYVRDAKP
ncbi:MAG TPA: hypothetical protein V6C76_00585 [Drouetiella sp.]